VHNLQEYLVLANGLERRREVDAPAGLTVLLEGLAGEGVLVAYAAQDAGVW
jgi:hypothetical protein